MLTDSQECVIETECHHRVCKMQLDCLSHIPPGKEQSQVQTMSIVVGHLQAQEMLPCNPLQVDNFHVPPRHVLLRGSTALLRGSTASLLSHHVFREACCSEA